MLIKVLAAETNLGSATNVGSATVVRLLNNQNSAAAVTRKDSGGTTIGSCTAVNGQVIFLEKAATDTLTAASNGGSILVAKVAYGN